MKKGVKGQVSVFVIIAIIIVGLIIGIYVFYSNKKTETDKEFFASSEIKPLLNKVETSIIECSESVGREALEEVGLQGGYYNKPEKILALENAFVPYYYFEGQINYPKIQDIEIALENYFNDNLGVCLKKINNNFEIHYKKISSSASINDKKVDFDIDGQIKISREGHNIVYELKPISINSEIKEIYELAKYYTDSHNSDPAMYCISCVGNIAEEKNLYFDLIPVTDDISLIIISENHTYSEPYSYMFLNKYKGDERSPDLNIEDNSGIPEVPKSG